MKSLETENCFTKNSFPAAEILEMNYGKLRFTDKLKQEIAKQWRQLGEIRDYNIRLRKIHGAYSVTVLFDWGTYTPQRTIKLTEVPADWDEFAINY